MSRTEPRSIVRVLLVSSWQTVNIGDVAHTPGALAALTSYAPEAEISLLAMALDGREQRMLQDRFPDVRVVQSPTWEGTDVPTVVLEEFDRADVLVHGSGPSVVVPQVIDAWRARSDKPYGFFGITVDPFPGVAARLRELRRMGEADAGDLLATSRDRLDGASFVFCRDSLTRDLLRRQGVRAGCIEFGPDATVAFDAWRPASAAPFLDPDPAEPLLCVVPRARYTPYHTIRGTEPTLTQRRRDAYNHAYADSDLAMLDTAIEWWLGHTDGMVLVVPEMSYAVDLAAGRWRSGPRLQVLDTFWELPEAAAVYARAAAVVSMECHSPLIALAVGTPALHVRQPTDTMKGAMYADLGLGDDIVEVVDRPVARIEQWLSHVIQHPDAARQAVRSAHTSAVERLADMSRVAASAGAGRLDGAVVVR